LTLLIAQFPLCNIGIRQPLEDSSLFNEASMRRIPGCNVCKLARSSPISRCLDSVNLVVSAALEIGTSQPKRPCLPAGFKPYKAGIQFLLWQQRYKQDIEGFGILKEECVNSLAPKKLAHTFDAPHLVYSRMLRLDKFVKIASYTA
jgi:hypothetical protein